MYEYDDLNESYINDPSAEFGWIEPNGLKVPGSPDDRMHGDVLQNQLGRDNRKIAKIGRRWVDVGGTQANYSSGGYNPNHHIVPDFEGAFKEGHVRYVNSPKKGLDLSFTRENPQAAHNAIKFIHNHHVGQKIHIDVMDHFKNLTKKHPNSKHYRGNNPHEAEQWIKSQALGQEFHPSATAQYREESMDEVERVISRILEGEDIEEIAIEFMESTMKYPPPVSGEFKKGQRVMVTVNHPVHHPDRSRSITPGGQAKMPGIVIGDMEDGRVKVQMKDPRLNGGAPYIHLAFPDAVKAEASNDY